MFTKVLVANRGEIAIRIMRTLRSMGIGSVAVFTPADAGAMHVAFADEAVELAGPLGYLDADEIIAAVRATGAQAVHPGYGFLSERTAFAEGCAAAGIVFIGPAPEHLRDFGEKHVARERAAAAGVRMLPGTELLPDLEHALAAADEIGYPVMLKASSGGGGIGMRRCADPEDLAAAYDAVQGLAERNFGGGGVFLERFVTRARHVEVQIFGDGSHVVALGDRDCSAQRRNQKVVEEAPAPGLSEGLRHELHDAAERLGRSIGYRSAGTVEFVVDADREDFSFLEVNTRLQVEHPVTELVWGVDLVEWMLLEAAGELGDLDRRKAELTPAGAALEARIYAEDPADDYRPSPGTLTNVQFPAAARVDTWVETGTDVSPLYDPMLAKVIVSGADRSAAVSALASALADTRIDGVHTNVAFLRDVIASEEFRAGGYPTSMLATLDHRPQRVEVLDGGIQTTVQDTPGRVGYWAVGVPPSGPMDDLSLRRANQRVGNLDSAAGLECTRIGPVLRFTTAARVALCGARTDATLDGAPVAFDAPIEVASGSVLRVGTVTGAGARTYLAVAGGIDVPEYLGSRATFVMGAFGGHAGRPLRSGDAFGIGRTTTEHRDVEPGPPAFSAAWEIGVVAGPHGAPEFFTEADIEMLHGVEWRVHHHSDRTGVRLSGPAPQWARDDGGEAGLHPSNIHDNAYAIGAIDFTGDMPVIIGPDGPSLGGFVCPITVVAAERWKVGQLSPGDTVRFVPVAAVHPVITRVAATAERPEFTVRRAGDEYALVEFGPNVLDLELRARVHALQTELERGVVPGIAEMVPGIRSLLLRTDRSRSVDDVAVDVRAVEGGLSAISELEVPSRVVHLPLSWADPSTQLAVDRYMQLVRNDAPWCPSNLEFIRRINGLDSIDDIERIVFDATYLVLGLGDVYLGAPVATPLDPRHRLVTTKYNPARTWTPQNAVGIGGAYMCIYGMEGPGGYQLVGRTLQIWDTYRRTPEFPGEERWSLRWFDQIRFHPVTTHELDVLRRDFAAGRHRIEIEPTVLRLADHRAMLAEHADAIAQARARQQQAFAVERNRWVERGEFDRVRELLQAAADAATPVAGSDLPLDAGLEGVRSPVTGVVQRVVESGTQVRSGETVVVVEAMKTETGIAAPCDGTVVDVRCAPGDMVAPGGILAGVAPA